MYKLVEIDGMPRLKLSQDVEKVTMPGRKRGFRLYGIDGFAILDLLQMPDEAAPQVGLPRLEHYKFPYEDMSKVCVCGWQENIYYFHRMSAKVMFVLSLIQKAEQGLFLY